MTEEEFNKIPILPTSQLSNPSANTKMAAVHYEWWFDALLLECCKKEQGMHLVSVHAQRLDRLSPKQLEDAGYPTKDKFGLDIYDFFFGMQWIRILDIMHLLWHGNSTGTLCTTISW